MGEVPIKVGHRGSRLYPVSAGKVFQFREKA